uniref:CUB domain-containing protein n=1 Tax=Plectus sambesii TaxID=2011161 RepID=A0A914X7L9_9BILA
MYTATATYTQTQMAVSYHCYWPVMAPAGTQIEYNYPAGSYVYSECNAACSNTSVQVSDNFQTPSNPVCCASNFPSVQGTTTSNLLLVVLYANNEGRGFGITMRVRYIGTPSLTTVAPPGTCPIGGQISFRNICLGPCSGLSYQATSSWQYPGFGFSSGNNCYIPFTGPEGSRVQLNVTNIYGSMCNAGCTVTAVTFSDNFQPAVGTTYCCAGDKPSFTTTTNKAMLVIQATTQGVSVNVAYRYIGASGAVAPTTPTIPANANKITG